MGDENDKTRLTAKAHELVEHQVSQTPDGAILLRLSVALMAGGAAERQHSILSVNDEVARQLALDLLHLVGPMA